MAVTDALENAVRTVAEVTAQRREDWDALDAVAGDGDFGTTVQRGFAAVLDGWDELDRDGDRAFLVAVSRVLARVMGGTSGPLWSVAFLRAGAAAGKHDGLDADAVGALLRAAANGVGEYGGAEVGDKTLLDALEPAADALTGGGSWADAVAAAVDGAEHTRELRAQRGRAAYAGHRTVGAPDTGAVAVATLAAALAGDDAHAERLEALHRAAQDAEVEEDGEDASEEPATKKFVNDPADAAVEALAGLAAAEPDLVAWDPERRIVVRAGGPVEHQVGLVSGGGSGHEPLHAGMIGPGMLTAVAPGEVFASPSVDQVLEAVRAAQAGAGVLQIVKNYTGDVMNFRLAAELAREEGIEVASVLVADDVASGDEEHSVGRRGTAATLAVEKVAGGRAAAGGTLEEVSAVAQRAADAAASMGVALGACSPPGGGPVFTLGDDELELGVGIHGELGSERGPMRPADSLVAGIVERLLGELEPAPDARLLAFVNGFGGSSVMELYVLFRAVAAELEQRGLTLARSLVGDYVTSLDMEGASITLLVLDEELTELWDAPVHTAALRWGV